MELFEMAFAADPLLSRSVVASLDFDPLLPVLLKAPIPVEVMAATLSHHIKRKGYYQDSSKEVCMDGYIQSTTQFFFFLFSYIGSFPAPPPQKAGIHLNLI